MAFGQLTHRVSLSDTALCLKLQKNKLYHLGIGRAFSKSTISRANEIRDWRIFRDFGLKLIEQAKLLYAHDNQLDLKLKGRIYVMDDTVIDLCLNVNLGLLRQLLTYILFLTLKPPFQNTFTLQMVQYMM